MSERFGHVSIAVPTNVLARAERCLKMATFDATSFAWR